MCENIPTPETVPILTSTSFPGACTWFCYGLDKTQPTIVSFGDFRGPATFTWFAWRHKRPCTGTSPLYVAQELSSTDALPPEETKSRYVVVHEIGISASHLGHVVNLLGVLDHVSGLGLQRLGA